MRKKVETPLPTAVRLCAIPVSYTHLDVYKRQEQGIAFASAGTQQIQLSCQIGGFPAPARVIARRDSCPVRSQADIHTVSYTHLKLCHSIPNNIPIAAVVARLTSNNTKP